MKQNFDATRTGAGRQGVLPGAGESRARLARPPGAALSWRAIHRRRLPPHETAGTHDILLPLSLLLALAVMATRVTRVGVGIGYAKIIRGWHRSIRLEIRN
jgi:hypothetical protein